MRITIDASVLESSLSGVGKTLLCLYNACAELRADLQAVGLHRTPLCADAALTLTMRTRKWLPFLPQRLWRQYAIPLHNLFWTPAVIHFPWNTFVAREMGEATIVLTLHDVIPLALAERYFQSEEDLSRYRMAQQAALDRADLILTDSECSKQDICKYLRPQKEPLVVYPANTLRMSATAAMPSNIPQSPFYIYFGGFEARKGLDTLLEVYCRLYREHHVTCPLLLVGEPNPNMPGDFSSALSAAKAEGAVIEAGYVSDGDLLTLLTRARALIFPSRYEGFGLPPLEAMTAGCPVITTNVSSMPEVCQDAAIYCRPGDNSDLANAIEQMEKQEVRLVCRERGLVQARRFSWKRSAQIYLDALDDLGRRRNAPIR